MNLTQLPAKVEEVVSSLLTDTTPEMKNSFRNLLIELFSLTLEMPEKLNYTQLGRLGRHDEKTYRTAFGKQVDWSSIDEDAIFKVFKRNDHMSIVIDPSFLQKSGKCTPCTGLYWSGVSGSMRHGLEINAIGVADVEAHDCMVLSAPLTPPKELLKENGVNLRKWYLITIISEYERLMKISNRVTADAFFATRDFCDGLASVGMHLVSRLHGNACLRYIHDCSGNQSGKRGRPMKYDGQVDVHNPDMSVFLRFEVNDVHCLTATLNSRALGRDIVVTVFYPKNGGKPLIYFSSDLSLTGEMVIEFYRLRFQIEFCIRDAKQYMGLGQSQSRKYRAMGFAANLSFAALNVAKPVIHKENLGISIGQLHLIMMFLATANRLNSRYAEQPTSRKIAEWDIPLRKLAGISTASA